MLNIQRDDSRTKLTIGINSPVIKGRPTEISFIYSMALHEEALETISKKYAEIKRLTYRLNHEQLVTLAEQTKRSEAYYSSYIEGEIKELKPDLLKLLIEGNDSILNEKERSSFYAALEVISYIRNQTEVSEVNQNVLKEAHRRLMGNDTQEASKTSSSGNAPGVYRTSDNTKVKRDGKIVFVPPMAAKLQDLMSDFFSITSQIIPDPNIRAAAVQMILGYIHPFEDGNGRTIRPVMTDILNHEVIKSSRGQNFRVMDFCSLSEAFCNVETGGYFYGYLQWLGKVSSQGYRSGAFEIDEWFSYFTKTMIKSLEKNIDRLEKTLSAQLGPM